MENQNIRKRVKGQVKFFRSKMKYNKLVRDKIPDIIRKDNLTPIIHIANEDEYWRKLKEKLKEEVKEFIEDSNEEELSDILEVIYAICYFKDIDKNKLEKIRMKKAEEDFEGVTEGMNLCPRCQYTGSYSPKGSLKVFRDGSAKCFNCNIWRKLR